MGGCWRRWRPPWRATLPTRPAPQRLPPRLLLRARCMPGGRPLAGAQPCHRKVAEAMVDMIVQLWYTTPLGTACQACSKALTWQQPCCVPLQQDGHRQG